MVKIDRFQTDAALIGYFGIFPEETNSSSIGSQAQPCRTSTLCSSSSHGKALQRDPWSLHGQAASTRLCSLVKRESKESKGTHVNAGGVVPLILRGVVDLHLKTWFNLGGNAG